MAAKSRPLIGITGPDRGGAVAWYLTRMAVWLAGGRSVRVTPSQPRPKQPLDGLIIGGGADVDPALYGEQIDDDRRIADLVQKGLSWRQLLINLLALIFFPILLVLRKLFSVKRRRGTGMDKARDALEKRLIDEAVQRPLPILGICRGAQLLNVHFGGSLYQDLKEFYVETPQVQTILPKKHVTIEKDSKLASILRVDACKVNALHKQAIKQNGRGIKVAARERNTVVQAIEHEALPFVLGVQWHPEYLQQDSRQRLIFKALIQAAGASTGSATRLDRLQRTD